jgi:DNA-binding beta-propeller fold protein YncE
MKSILLVSVSCLLFGCSYEKLELDTDATNYPKEIANILVKKCATAGCHDNISRDAASGLSLETWDELFKGTRGGAAVIPFRPDHSTLLFFTNTDSTKGVKLTPTMPYNLPPLSNEEYEILKSWIEKGAPDKNGFVKFSDYQSKQKLYLSNQDIDGVTVFDPESFLTMRFIDVGVRDTIELPRSITISPDNQFWYVVMYNGSMLQKYRTSDNSLVANLDLGAGYWMAISITADSKKAFVASKEINGKVAYVDLESMTLIQQITGFSEPNCLVVNQTGTVLYATSQSGNFIYKINLNPVSSPQQIVLSTNDTPSTTNSLDPHAIIFNSDYSKYYVSCQRSNEVRVMQTSNDSLLAIISTVRFPTEMALAKNHPYLFVTCMDADNPGISILGRLEIIDINNNTIIKSIIPGHQPHGIAISNELNRVYVSNRNKSHGGPVPHHSTSFGRNGYMTVIDMNTLDLIPGMKAEVSVDPYSITITK